MCNTTTSTELKIESNLEDTSVEVKTDITPAMFNVDIETIAYLPSHSPFHKVFNERQGHLRISVDRVNKNSLISKFKIQITGDTTSAPYNFEFLAPNLFKKMGSSIDRATVTVNHQKGKSLNIKSNICGGIELDVNHTPNSLGGRTINVLATKAGAQMFKYHGDTSMVTDAAMLKVGLRGEFDLGPKIILTIMSNSWREGLCTGATGNYYLDRSSIGPCPEERNNIVQLCYIYCA